MDITFSVVVAATSLAAAYAGWRAGKNRSPAHHTHELNKIGKLLRAPRLRGENNDAYAARLAALMQTENTHG